jgi:hypothetical protein
VSRGPTFSDECPSPQETQVTISPVSEPRSETRRGAQTTGALVALLAAALLVLGSTVPRWWSGAKGDGEWGIGVASFELCLGDVCRSRDLQGLGGGSEAWPMLGSLGGAGGWAAAVFLVLAALAVLVARRSRWTSRLSRVASALSMIALVVGAGFAWTYPGFSGLGAGWAMLAYLGGAALGVGSAGVLIAGGGARPAA